MATEILIDSDVMVDYFRGNSKAVALIQSHSAQLILPAIVIAELYAGVKGNDELQVIDRLISVVRVAPLTNEIARAAGIYRNDYYKSHGVGLADAIVAATVDAYNAVLKTLNVKHYPMFRGLKPAYRK